MPPPSAAALPPVPAKSLSHGVYQDDAGKTHSWRVTASHILEWDGAPYLPAGMWFTPQSWTGGGTDDAWNVDVQTLQAFKKNGVSDLILSAGATGLTHVDPQAVQRLLNYLDQNGFRYGLQVADFPDDPLVGYTVEPNIFRSASPQAGPVRFSNVSGLKDALYFLVASGSDASDSSNQFQTGSASITANGTATVNVPAGSDADVLLLYPRRQFSKDTPEGRLPDVWKGYDDYRDRLIAFFSHVTLGSGFRFFLDPLSDRIGMNGEVLSLVPTSTEFQLGFQAWLDQRYAHNKDTLNSSWGLGEQYLPDFETAARVLPLWAGKKGIPELYDPQKNIGYPVTDSPQITSQYWQDLERYKQDSVRDDMNAIADALKHAVADVPVVYTWTQHSPLFTISESDGGYDGLGMPGGADAAGDAYTYAQAQEAARTSWLFADAATSSAAGQNAPAFGSQPDLFGDWDALKNLGARGFFTGTGTDQLPWIGAYAASLQQAGPLLDAERPAVLWYPQSIAGGDVHVKRLSGDVWWLPTYNSGQVLTLGPSLEGYELASPEDGKPLNVLWATDESVKSAKFDLGKQSAPFVTTPAGTPLLVSHKGTVWTIPVNTEPTVVHGVPTLPLTADAADNADLQAQRLVALAGAQNVSLGTIPEDLFRVENDISDDSAFAGQRYAGFEVIVNNLEATLQPYVWVEAEATSTNNFTSVAPNADASGGAYLSLDTAEPPPVADTVGYQAVYTFTVNAPGNYNIWLAASPAGADASPFTWQIDQDVPNDGNVAPTAGGVYGGKFVWADLGTSPLRPGQHTLTIAVTSPRSRDQHYALDLDAFCITRAPFQPDGPEKPPLSSWLPAMPLPKSGKKH